MSIDLKEFRAGKFTNQFGYRSFHPDSINQEWVISHAEVSALLEEATLRYL